MIELGKNGELTAGELSSLLHLDKSTMSRTLAELIKNGLIAARPVQPALTRDRRRKPLALTAKGKRKLEAIHENANSEVNDALALLDDQERRAVVQGMALYAKALRRARAAHST